ncbi:L-threonylcarbamoyladenylate synthase [Haloferacaceae archaeon DSL9]
MREAIANAADAVARGEAVVYPTETVYGLGADATDSAAVERVFELKRRDRDKPLSFAVPTVEAALAYSEPTARERRFMREFLPGPVTVVVERTDALADELTAGRDRVGVRIPDHDVALQLLEAIEPTPLTATSANRSGEPSVRRIADLPAAIRDGVGAVVDDGEAPGTESTVVDPGSGVIHRRGARADEIEAWLDAH